MPYKANQSKRHHIPSQKYIVTNTAQYNQALRNRGRIDIWICDDIIENWQTEQVHDGTGSSRKFPNSTIEACLQIRMILKFPLRQTQGFINYLLELMKRPDLKSPDYSTLSARNSTLGLTTPRFKKGESQTSDIAALAIDSTGLKVFGHDEWHSKKHKISAKRTWKKAHFGVNNDHFIESALLTSKDVMDFQVVDQILAQVDHELDAVTMDKMYDLNSVYEQVEAHSPDARIVIPPKDNTFADEGLHPKRLSNLIARTALGPIPWQRRERYGDKNYPELCVQRYKKILGNKLHSRNETNQKPELLIGYSILNRFTQLGMPRSGRNS